MLQTPVHPSSPGADELLSVTTVPGRHRGRVVVEVVGEVDAYTVPLLEACLRSQASRDDVRELVVDLRRVTFLDAAGVGVLARARERCRSRGARLVVRTGGRRRVLHPLEVTGLSELVDVDPAGTGLARPLGPRTRGRRSASSRRPSAGRPRPY